MHRLKETTSKKTTTQVKTVIEDLVAGERIVESNWPNTLKGMYELNAQHNLLALPQNMQVQIEAMTKAIKQSRNNSKGSPQRNPTLEPKKEK